MNRKQMLLSFAVAILMLSPLVSATSTITVTPNNIVLSDAAGNCWIQGLNATWLNGTSIVLYGSNPNTSSWGVGQEGVMWFNGTLAKYEFWDGTQAQIMPSITGSGATGNYTFPSTFTVDFTGSTWTAEDTTGNTKYTNSNCTLALQYAENQLTSGGTIYVSQLLDVNTFRINNSNVAIYTMSWQHQETGSSWWSTPRINQTIIDASSADITDTTIQGVNMRGLDFYANGHAIVGVTINGVGFRPDGTTGKGIRFLGDHIIYYVTFYSPFILDVYNQATDNAAAIFFNESANVGTGQIYFYNLIYKAYATNAVMCSWGTADRTDECVEFIDPNIVDVSQTGFKPFYFQAGSKQKPLVISNPSFELHKTCTIFTMNAGLSGSATQLHQIQFNGAWLSGGDASQTITFITNSAADGDYYGQAMGWFSGCNNRFFTDNGISGTTWTLGTTGAVAHFAWNLGYTYYNGTTLVSSANMTG